MHTILNHHQILLKIQRLGHEVIEHVYPEKAILVGGIIGNGYELANRISNIIAEHSNIQTHPFEITINKSAPWSEPITTSISDELLENAYIVLVDDVINSGKTLQYALAKILQRPTKAIKTLALVDRTHRRYPIKADFVGINLSTTITNRVDVTFDEKKSSAFLI
jgi:pyrimidine operon attenuation protein/uracil phosphoribosyltransferase